jgi:hypothetical protein
MRYALVLGFAAAGLWAAPVFAQDCCAGSKDRGSYKEESGSSLEGKAWTRASVVPALTRPAYLSDSARTRSQ